MLKQKASFTERKFNRKPIGMADNSPMDVRGRIQVDIKLGVIILPAEFSVIDRLSYDVIVGQDILEATRASTHTHTKTLSLYDGLINIPMTQLGDFEFVKTTSTVTISPLSEALVNVYVRIGLRLPGCTKGSLRIVTGNNPPVRMPSYRMSPEGHQEAQR